MFDIIGLSLPAITGLLGGIVILLTGVDIFAAEDAIVLRGIILFAEGLPTLLAALAIWELFARLTDLVTLLEFVVGFLATLALVALLALFLGADFDFAIEALADFGAAFLEEAATFFAVVFFAAVILREDEVDAFLDFDDFFAVEVSNSIGMFFALLPGIADFALPTASSEFLLISFETMAKAFSRI